MNELKMQFFIPCHIPRGKQAWKQDFTSWVSLPCISVTMAVYEADQSHSWQAHFT